MYNIKLGNGEAGFELKTEKKPVAKVVARLAMENGVLCIITEEAAPRVVKFKDIDAPPAVDPQEPTGEGVTPAN